MEKKVWPEFFREIASGNKTFEMRLDDFECRPGDVLVLKEWDPETRQYTGNVLERKVGFVLKTKDVKFWPKEDVDRLGFQIISLK